MAYYVAIPSGEKFIIASGESFEIRSNALAYAKRMGWEKVCFIATSEQRAMIEGGQLFSPGVASSVENVTTIVAPEETTEPDKAWMEKEGIPWNKSLRSKKKK